MTTTLANLQDLLSAYVYEQKLISAWGQDMINPLPPDKNNPMQLLFAQIWSRYFQEVQESNQWIIDSFRKIPKWPNPTATDMQNFANFFSGKEHDPGAMRFVSLETAKQAAGADINTLYLPQLDRLIKLEEKARDKMWEYIK